MSKIKILLVEDEADFGFILKQYLEIYGFEVLWYKNPLDALQNITLFQNHDIAILDVMMPDLDGFSLAKQLQSKVSFPFLFLTAKNQQIDRILGLKLGADDYISKPCDPEELILRIHNILKRTESTTELTNYKIGTYQFLPDQLVLKHQDTVIQLTEREVELLLFLIRYNNQVITREMILNDVWKSNDYFTGRSMDVFMSRLRKYFQYDDQIKIQSVRSVGFLISFPN